MYTKKQSQKLSAKEQLACGEITVVTTKKGHLTEKPIVVPHWLFDLATHTDEFIFENIQELHGSRHLKQMSTSLFNGLLIELRAKHR